MMEYKGFIGLVEFDAEAAIFHGDVVNTRDVITFQGKSVTEIRKAFRESVDDYLEFCRQRGEEPDKPFSGKLVLRMEPALHRALAIAARRERKSLNSLIVEKLGQDYRLKAFDDLEAFAKTVKARRFNLRKAIEQGRR